MKTVGNLSGSAADRGHYFPACFVLQHQKGRGQVAVVITPAHCPRDLSTDLQATLFRPHRLPSFLQLVLTSELSWLLATETQEGKVPIFSHGDRIFFLLF